MTAHRRFLYISTFCLMVAVAACAASRKATPTEIPLLVEPILSSQICLPAAKNWTATWISSQDSLRQMMSRVLSHRIGGISHKVPPIDFSSYGILAVEMGEQRTAGYGFDSKAVSAYMTGTIAVVKLVWHRPDPGSHTAQLMTSPCILLRLPKKSYNTIRVIDKQGLIVTSVALHKAKASQ